MKLFFHRLKLMHVLLRSVRVIYFRAVKVNALFYEIIVAEINAIKYLNAVNATLFTSGVRFCSQLDRRDRDGS